MKKLVFIALTMVKCCLLSCGGTGSGNGEMTDTEKKNLETARSVSKMFETGDWSKIGDYIDANATDHAAMEGDVTGLDNIKASLAKMTANMGDMKNEPVQEVAEGDYVYQWLKESGTPKADEMGMKAGVRQTFSMIEVSKFKDGKIIEHWSFMDVKDMMKMMPAMGPNEMMPKSDSAGTKK
jgi:predicted ester cyclase